MLNDLSDSEMIPVIPIPTNKRSRHCNTFITNIKDDKNKSQHHALSQKPSSFLFAFALVPLSRLFAGPFVGARLAAPLGDEASALVGLAADPAGIGRTLSRVPLRAALSAAEAELGVLLLSLGR